MESFVLSETLKVRIFRCCIHFIADDGFQYLFLLFDEDNVLHTDDSNYVFTTEGHILFLGREHLKTPSSTCEGIPFDMQLCPAYRPRVAGNDTRLLQGIRSHVDIDYSRELVALLPERAEQELWSPNGWCEKPKTDVVVRDKCSPFAFKAD
jgi:mannosidase alpha-like ER degradation enhancer 1